MHMIQRTHRALETLKEDQRTKPVFEILKHDRECFILIVSLVGNRIFQRWKNIWNHDIFNEKKNKYENADIKVRQKSDLPKYKAISLFLLPLLIFLWKYRIFMKISGMLSNFIYRNIYFSSLSVSISNITFLINQNLMFITILEFI